MMDATTQETTRTFVCRLCGVENVEPLEVWKRKPQKQKNICELCIDHRKIAAETRRERMGDMPYCIF